MKRIPTQYQPAIRLEQLLGDPERGENLFSFRQALEWDEQEQFPEPAMARLHELGLHHIFVPRSLGGQFEASETFIALGRTLARRDMTVAVAYSTMLWAMLGWMGADPGQQRQLADAILQGGEFPCLAYSEEAHGADLIGNETTARLDARGDYRVAGEKWPINRATRSEWVVLLARTEATARLRNHSLFIFPKAGLAASEYETRPRARTHGLRGCDISGLRFHDCRLPPDAQIGRAGEGLELALKGFQITRTFCTSLSLGVGDSALRLVSDFVRGRRLYGRRVAELPHARDTLANAYLSLLLGECAAVAAARGLQLFPAQFSTWSAIAKVQVSRLTDQVLHQLGGILGARSYLREGATGGMFQKFLRDGAIVAVFDGSNIVCLDQLATALPHLCRGRPGAGEPLALAALFDLQHPLPPWDFGAFTLRGRGQDVVFQSLSHLAAKLAGLFADRDCDAEVLATLRERTAALQRAVAQLQAEVRNLPPARGARNSAVRFGLAERYCALHAAICALGFWLFNRDQLGVFVARGEWLAAALARQGEATFRCGTLSELETAGLCERMFEQTKERQMYSLIPWQLAASGQGEASDDGKLFPAA